MKELFNIPLVPFVWGGCFSLVGYYLGSLMAINKGRTKLYQMMLAGIGGALIGTGVAVFLYAVLVSLVP